MGSNRPIYFESDGDPGGVADAIGLHYVHEYPQYTCWPNEAYWLDRPFQPDAPGSASTSEPFVWKKEKPMYIGEFLWVPSGTPAGKPCSSATRRIGILHRTLVGQGRSMEDADTGIPSPGSRWHVPLDGRHGLDESNPLYRAHQYAYQPIAAYCHDYDRRFYAGEWVCRAGWRSSTMC